MGNLKINLTKLSLLVMLSFATVLISSCSNNDDRTEEQPQDTSGKYWPLKINNAWLLIDDNGSEVDYIIDKSFVYQDKTYYQLKPIGNDPTIVNTTAINEENGVYKMHYGETTNNNVTISEGSIDYINTNLAIGEIWKQEMKLKISGAVSGEMKFTHEGKILAKSQTETVNGKVYKDVIKVELKQTVFNSLTGYTFLTTYQLWLSKGVGLIYEKSIVDGEEVNLKLVSYTVN